MELVGYSCAVAIAKVGQRSTVRGQQLMELASYSCAVTIAKVGQQSEVNSQRSTVVGPMNICIQSKFEQTN